MQEKEIQERDKYSGGVGGGNHKAESDNYSFWWVAIGIVVAVLILIAVLKILN